MGRKPKQKQRRQARATSSRDKGRLVERIVARMHDRPGIKVEINVFLRPHHAKGSKREIDILITSEVAGYPVQIAIECKNKKKPVGIDYIDAFVGKLNYVGIRHGIYVSSTGYPTAPLE